VIAIYLRDPDPLRVPRPDMGYLILIRCQETNHLLSIEKLYMLLTKGIVLVSFAGIKVDLEKVEAISKI
jgi:hypothetical protein